MYVFLLILIKGILKNNYVLILYIVFTIRLTLISETINLIICIIV